jgi:double-stranded uracil-DNA glycosylase
VGKDFAPYTETREIGTSRRAIQPSAQGTMTEDAPRHVLPDLLAPGMRLVFCGSAAGRVSALKGLPYAGPGNKFWPTLHAVGLTPRLFAPAEWRALGPLGIGITDLNKTQSGSDTDLTREHDDVDGLVAKIERFRPRILAFAAKRPAGVVLRARFGVRRFGYGRQPQALGGAALFVLPSPSGRAGAFWDPAPWRDLAECCDLLARPQGNCPNAAP